MKHRSKLALFAAGLAALWPSNPACALWWGTYGAWDSQVRKDAADAAMLAVVNRFNSYGDFNAGSDGWIDVYYNPGVPTAEASWNGAITFGGTWPGERVAMHELNHWLGSVYGHSFDGPRAIAILEQFDGVGARFGHDSAHFWPYGLNYDNEWSEVGAQRNVAIMYALRGDWGIGPTSNPTAWAATSVSLTDSDAPGESGFNHASKWSDNTFAHPNANYSTGPHSIRTPNGYPSWTFAGNSLTVNPGGRLLYNGWGTTGVVTIRNLTVNGGTVRHDQFPQDLFQLAGKVTLLSNATFEAANGDIKVLANIGGTGSLIKTGSRTLTLAGGNSYTGNTTISSGILRLAPTSAIASYTFDNVSGSTVINAGTGGASMNGSLANGAAIVPGGRFGSAVTLANGASVNINNPIVDLGNTGTWTITAWVKTSVAGGSILTKGDGTGWSYGNTIFYLGDGTAGGSGGIPSGVRWAGGFFQGSTSAKPVNDNAWHHLAYVNSAGEYSIYVDGVAQPLSAGNGGFSVPDVGSVVRLGVSTNTVAGDGTVNFNGLLDGVQFYAQALSPSQVATLFQGLPLRGPLPVSTNVSIASGATLDVNGVVQQIASLSGPNGSAVTLGSGQLIISSPTGNTVFGGVISGTGSLVKEGNSGLTLSGANTYTGPTTVNGGQLVSRYVRGGALTIAPTARVTLSSNGGTSDVAALNIAGTTDAWTGRLDLTDNDLVIRSTAANRAADYARTLNQLKSGLNEAAGAFWTGNGITSSTAAAHGNPPGTLTAVGAILNDFFAAGLPPGPIFTGFSGRSVTANDILLKYTWFGDADLSGVVDGTDYFLIDQAFAAGTLNGGWLNGDFNYSGSVDGTDYFLIDQAFNAQTGPPGASVAAVPEPSTLGLLAIAAITARRRRKQ